MHAAKSKNSGTNVHKMALDGLKNKKPRSVKPDFAKQLLVFEEQVRDISEEEKLFAHLVNDSRRLLGFRQCFLFRRNTANGPFVIKAASSIPVIDRDAPMMRWVEKIINRMDGDVDTSEQKQFSLPAYCDDTDEEKDTYPFGHMCWTPIYEDETVIGGFLQTSEKVSSSSNKSLAIRIAKLYAHANRAVTNKNKTIRAKKFTRKNALIGGIIAALICIIPVPITALAPVTVVPFEPYIVAAPIDGVVKEIVVNQGDAFEEGALLIRFDNVEQSNEAKIAERRATVAQVRLAQTSQTALYDPNTKRELAIAKAEYDLAVSEKEYADDILSKTTIAAPTSGLAIFTDKRDWEGRPVNAGQAILEIANPEQVHFSIDLPVKESIVLSKGAPVRIFLDSDPLNPISATLTQTAYQSRSDENNIISYRLFATVSSHNTDTQNLDTLPRIGVKGTAQISGNKVPLIYSVLRRPLSALRQMTGM